MVTKLTLSNGEWIDVKDRQTVRDEKEIYSYSNEGISLDANRYNIIKHRIATAAIRIKNWSLTNEDGKVIPWPAGKSFKERVDVIESLYEDQGDMVTEAITAHLNALAAARADQKKETQAGETTSEPSSLSAS
jgi:hypothetical protein